MVSDATLVMVILLECNLSQLQVQYCIAVIVLWQFYLLRSYCIMFPVKFVEGFELGLGYRLEGHENIPTTYIRLQSQLYCKKM